MKIAFFTDTFTPEVNGVATTLARLSSYLKKKEIQHIFFAPEYEANDGKDVDGAFSETGSTYRFPGLKFNVSPNSRLAFPIPVPIFNICDEFKPDIVHVTTEFGIGHAGLIYSQVRKLPLVMSYHTDYCNYLKYHSLTPLGPIAEFFFKQFYSRSDSTLVPSRFTLEQLRGKGYDNLSIWSRGIDTGNFNPEFRSYRVRDELGIGERFAFLNVGRLSSEKGLDTLMYAIGRINECYPGEAVFVITGDGPYEKTIRRAGFKNVILTGFKRGHELSEIYASCDGFAFPSATETFGNTGLEAMASGLAVAGINSGGVTEYLVHGQNGLLSDNGDKDGFVTNLMELMKNKDLRTKLSVNALITAGSRDWDRVSESLITEHKAVIERKTMSAFKRVS